jgi:hypothetical protein
LIKDFATECDIILNEMGKNIEKDIVQNNKVINDSSDDNDNFHISLGIKKII